LAARYNVIFLAAALIVGIAVGFGGSSFAYRHHFLRLRGESPIGRMSRELKLTTSQTSALHEIVQSTGAQVMELRRECEQQRNDLMTDAYAQVRAMLNPGQQHAFDRDFVPAALRAKVERGERGAASPAPTAAFTPMPATPPAPSAAPTSQSGA